MRLFQPGVALLLSSSLLLLNGQPGFAYQAGSQNPPQAVEESPEQLQQLVAPIALYPDALIAQILPAASYPEQIVQANQWMQEHKDLTGKALADEVNKQAWDESVKAMTQFPAVLANMNQNLAWTSELGDAYINQQQAVSEAIQTMREKAKNAGNLKTTPQEKVKTKGQNIVIEPASSDIVYVPEYDPWLVYGYPLAVFPGWYPYPGLYWDEAGIGFGLGFGIGFFGGFGWGWHNWGYDWHHGGRVVFNHNSYFSHSTTIMNRNGFRAEGGVRGGDFRGGGGSFGHEEFRGGDFSRGGGMHSSAFSGFDHGGTARFNSFRGQSSFGGFGGGGFHGGGFGGGFHGGGGRR